MYRQLFYAVIVSFSKPGWNHTGGSESLVALLLRYYYYMPMQRQAVKECLLLNFNFKISQFIFSLHFSALLPSLSLFRVFFWRLFFTYVLLLNYTTVLGELPCF